MTANYKELCATNAAACKAWKTYKMVLTITCNNFAAAMDDVYYTTLDDPTKGLNTIDLRTLVIHIFNTNTQISQPDLDDNMTNFHSGIDSGLNMLHLCCQNSLLSAHEASEGSFSFNATPMAPLGTGVLVHMKPN
jgi:hypothetical protein